MKIELIPSTRKDKRFTMLFYDNNKLHKRVHFGMAGGKTYLEHKDCDIRHSWIKRHEVRGEFDNFMTPSSLSYHLLWMGPSLSENLDMYIKKFNLKLKT